jgi:hypothetical protein
MNLVMHRAQVALNMPDFDISEQVASQLNKMLPTVVIPPDGVPVSALQTGAATPDATAPAPATTTAAAATAEQAKKAAATAPAQHK